MIGHDRFLPGATLNSRFFHMSQKPDDISDLALDTVDSPAGIDLSSVLTTPRNDGRPSEREMNRDLRRAWRYEMARYGEE